MDNSGRYFTRGSKGNKRFSTVSTGPTKTTKIDSLSGKKDKSDAEKIRNPMSVIWDRMVIFYDNRDPFRYMGYSKNGGI